MPVSYSFHPEAIFEYAAATSFYLREASPRVTERFVEAVETAVASLVSSPERGRVVEEPDIRRYVFLRFPYVLYYRWEPSLERIIIYAVMHCSREPGYWHHRVEQRGPTTEDV